jgi:mRNA interferase MazF
MNGKDFDGWNVQKKYVQSNEKQIFFNVRDVWWIYLGHNIGREQDGKNEDYVRPVLVLRKLTNHMFIGIPLSTKKKQGYRFYLPFKHDGEEISAVLHQVRMFDSKRLKRRMYRLNQDAFEEIRASVVGIITGEIE